MRVCSLGSGSAGNATLIETHQGARVSRVLIDCGMPYKQLGERLSQRGLSFGQIDAVFVTHEHSDHVGCARQLAVQEELPLWMSRGTYRAIGAPNLGGRVHFAADSQLIEVHGLCLRPFTVPHDAKEPLQLTISDGQTNFGLLTDLGHVTPHVLACLRALHAIMLEFNHDEHLLREGSYPPFLKQRIAGGYGHLNNEQAAALLQTISHQGLRHVIAAHLSEQNNDPALVRSASSHSAKALGYEVCIANAQTGFDWIEL